MKLKKAAMFGLDARIALAIFGALSVISGAALYSAIENAKVISIITELNELGKAYDSYYLDTGVDLEVVVNPYLKIKDLVSSSTNNWKGPYISYLLDGSNEHVLKHSTYPNIFIVHALDGAWGINTENDWGSQISCSSGTVGGNCFAWVGVNDISMGLVNAIGKEIDDEVDGTLGSVRYAKSSSGWVHLFIKYRVVN